MTLFIIFWKKARVYYTLSISRGGGQAPAPPGFATGLSSHIFFLLREEDSQNPSLNILIDYALDVMNATLKMSRYHILLKFLHYLSLRVKFIKKQ